MGHFSPSRWSLAFALVILAGGAAPGQSNGDDRRTPEGRFYTTDPGDVDQTERRSPEGRRIAEPPVGAFQQEQTRLAREKQWLDQERARLDRVETWLREKKQFYVSEYNWLKTQKQILLAQDRANKLRVFRCPNGEPPSLCTHYSLKQLFLAEKLRESARLRRAAVEWERRRDAGLELERRYPQVEQAYSEDRQRYDLKKQQYEADLQAATASKGVDAGSKAGTLIFDDKVKRYDDRL